MIHASMWLIYQYICTCRWELDKVRSSRRKEGGDKADTGKIFVYHCMCYHCGIAELSWSSWSNDISSRIKKNQQWKKNIMKHTKRGGQHYGNVLWVIKSLIQVIKSLIQDYFSI